MTHILILGSNRSPNSASEKYRGTYRSRPNYQAHLDPQHEVNLAFEEYCEQGGESLVLSNITFARQIVQLYQHLRPPQNFDIIEAVDIKSAPQFAGKHLGYDVSLGTGHSLLCNGLHFNRLVLIAPAQSKPLIDLIENFYKKN
jgi:hypothetical protein